MKKIISILLAVSMALTLGSSIYAEDTVQDEAWASNIGQINLTDREVSGSGVSVDGNIVRITEGGDFTVTGTLEDGMIYINAEAKVKLRLSGASIINTTGPAIFFDNVEKGLITITEGTENTLTDGQEYTQEAKAALFSNDDLEIKGKGSLTVNANHNHGIASDDGLVIENGNITIISTQKDGLHANDDITISGEATLNITAQDDGIQSEGTMQMTGGSVAVNAVTGKGITADGDVTIDGGIINIINATEGIESKAVLTVNGGDIQINSTDDGLNAGGGFGGMGGHRDISQTFPSGSGQDTQGERPRISETMTPPLSDIDTPQDMQTGETEDAPRKERPQMQDLMPPRNGTNGQQGLHGGNMERTESLQKQDGHNSVSDNTEKQTQPTEAASNEININGGNIQITAMGDGIDSNGKIRITAGTIMIDGPTGGGDGALDCDGDFTIDGGTLIAVGSAGMVDAPDSTSKQYTVKAIFEAVYDGGTTITVNHADGTEIMRYTPAKPYQSLVFSDDTLKQGETCVIYVDGEQAQSFTVSEMVTAVGTASRGIMGKGQKGIRPDAQLDNRADGDEINVQLNGNTITFDQKPVIQNDSALVPLRAIFEALGAQVDWDEETQTVTAEKDGVKISLTAGSLTAWKNDELILLDTAPAVIGSRTMVPVRFIAESMGAQVGWDAQTQTVTIDV